MHDLPTQTGPALVLVQPQMGENIGAAARAMWNFGLQRLRIVAPRDGWPNPKAVAMASGAGRVLDNAGMFPTTAAALADVNYVFATTARGRELTKPVMTPERAMQHGLMVTTVCALLQFSIWFHILCDTPSSGLGVSECTTP